MVPPSLKDKWPKDWEVFKHKCLASSLRSQIRHKPADSGEAFLRLLDDPPSRKAHIIFLTHGALNRALNDGYAKLAVIKRAFKGRSSLAKQRSNFYKFAGRILRMDASVERRAPGLLGELLEKPYDRWLRIIHSADPAFKMEITDDPVPRHLAEALEGMDSSDLAEVVEELRRLPQKESAGIDDRLRAARHALSGAMKQVWKKSLRAARFNSPLLILDEAHHLKNPETRFASLFVDEEAAQESEIFETSGPLGGKFERMLFLTATPFQLGHLELVRVLERFEGIDWSSSHLPRISRPVFKQEVECLADHLDQAQAAALRLDRAWGKLTHGHLADSAGRELSVEEWWDRAVRANGDGIEAQIVEQVEAAQKAIRAAEQVLSSWVLRHLKSDNLPGAPNVARRRVLPGAAILDDNSSHIGLEIAGSIVLPFLLAGRAQVLLAASARGRALFAEGLASSFEAYVETRAGNVALDEDVDVASPEASLELEWYLRHLDRALPRENTAAFAAHPKIHATAERAVQLWKAGEKVLIFCHYRATGRALRRHISGRLHQEIVRMGSAELPDVHPENVATELESIGDRFFDTGGILRNEVTRSLESVIKSFPTLTQEEHTADQVVEVVRRFLRTPAFLVRYFPLNREDRAAAFAEAIEREDRGSISLQRRIRDFCQFLAERCIPDERRQYLEALEVIQTGTHYGRDVIVDSGEQIDDLRSAVLLPNVRLANGAVKPETRRRLLLTFNTPLFPEILIASSVLAEGVDLHLNCRYVIHHDLCWNPSTLEQRSGRVDRIGSKAEQVSQSIHLYMPYVAATQDEKMYRVVRDRERWFQIVMGEKYEVDELATDRRAERIPLPEAVQQQLVMRLHP